MRWFLIIIVLLVGAAWLSGEMKKNIEVKNERCEQTSVCSDVSDQCNNAAH